MRDNAERDNALELARKSTLNSCLRDQEYQLYYWVHRRVDKNACEIRGQRVRQYNLAKYIHKSRRYPCDIWERRGPDYKHIECTEESEKVYESKEEKRSNTWTHGGKAIEQMDLWMRIKTRRVHGIEPAKEVDSISSLSKHLCRQECMTDTARKRVREQTYWGCQMRNRNKRATEKKKSAKESVHER